MGYNSKQIKSGPLNKKKTNPYKGDVIVDPRGQWAHPGEITKIPSGNITMKGVNYPVFGVDNLGNQQMMYPGMEYTFPGQFVTEYPQMQQGGRVPIIVDDPADPRLHAYQDSLNLWKGYQKQLELNPDIQQNYINSKGMDAWNKNWAKSRNTVSYDPKSADRSGDIWYDMKDFKTGNVSGISADPNDVALAEYYESLKFSQPTSIGTWSTPDLGHKYIMPTGSYFGGTDADDYFGAWNPIYKKPVQPIKYSGNPADVNKYRGSIGVYGKTDTAPFDSGLPFPGGGKPVSTRTTPDVKRSVSDNLTSMGMDNSFAARKQLAEQAGFKNYTGTAEQNVALNTWLTHKYQQEQTPVTNSVTPTTTVVGDNTNTGSNTTTVTEPVYAEPKEKIMSYAEWRALNPLKQYGGNIKNMKKKKDGGTPEAFPQQPTQAEFFARGFVPQGPVGFYKQGGITLPEAFPQQPTPNVFFGALPWTPHYEDGGVPCLDCGGQHMKDGGWIQEATKDMRKDKPCTGSKFGGPDCPPGSKRYNLAKTFRAMAKKQFGGDTNDQQIINQMDEDDYIGNYSKTFMDKLRTNTISSIADEASDNVNQANQEFFAQFGMEVPNNYGYNPNMMGQKMYGDKADYMENQGANAINNFYNTSMDIASNANPYMAMSFMQDGGIPTGMSQDQFFAYMDAYNQRNQGQNTTPNYQSQWTPQNQGMNYFPMNSSPYIKWNTPRPQNRTQGYPVPNVQFNPQNTYLQSFDYKGRLLGPGARKVSMTFRTYIDPITGQPTQVPVENTGAIGTGTNNTPMVNPNIDVNPSGTPTMTPSGVPITPISGNQLSLIPEKNFDDFQLDKPFNNPPFTQDNSNYLTPQERKKRDNLPGDLRSMFMNLQQNKQERFNRKNPPRESAVHPGFLQYGGIPKAQFGMNAFGQPDNQFQGPLSPDFVNQNTQGFMPANTPDEQANYFDTTITGKRKMGFEPEASANWLLASITGATALANRGEQAKTEEEMQRLTLADNVFNPMPANRIQNQGRYNWTGMSSGMMDPNSMGVIQQPGQNYTGMYKQGGEYELSEDEINYIMKNGGSITYL